MNTHVGEVLRTTLELVRERPETIMDKELLEIRRLAPSLKNPGVEVASDTDGTGAFDFVARRDAYLKVLEGAIEDASSASARRGVGWERRDIKLFAVTTEGVGSIVPHLFGAEIFDVRGCIPVTSTTSVSVYTVRNPGHCLRLDSNIATFFLQRLLVDVDEIAVPRKAKQVSKFSGTVQY